MTHNADDDVIAVCGHGGGQRAAAANPALRRAGGAPQSLTNSVCEQVDAHLRQLLSLSLALEVTCSAITTKHSVTSHHA